jgi:hypothetical protein
MHVSDWRRAIPGDEVRRFLHPPVEAVKRQHIVDTSELLLVELVNVDHLASMVASPM